MHGNLERDTKRIMPAILMISLMLMSTQLLVLLDSGENIEQTDTSEISKRSAYQQLEQLSGPVQGEGQNQPASTNPFSEAPFRDPFYHDPASMYGKVSDPSALALDPMYGFYLEETNTEDHDNDGIDDLNDLDDDNDGINDLIERFDGCYGTDPYDHDNDGIQDEFDWDDDNDGILEGPIDYSQGTDPWNVTSDRHVEPSTIHPWTGQAVGFDYMVDQNPMDHDNDGITDEDVDGSGRGSFDEDDDNDGRIDQFVWPCDFDSDGIQDYFDIDDDGDGVEDILDIHPWDPEQTSLISESSDILWDGYSRLEHEDYSEFVDGLDYVALHALQHPRDQAFTEILDGDLDGDGIPNFLDPDNDNDGSPDSSDTDDDNDGLADMYDVDDDNDGIPDECRQLDTNGDGQGDYPIQAFNGEVVDIETPGEDCEIDYDGDLDDDRFRAIDMDYDLVWDWLDPDMGGSESPDNPTPLGSGDTPWDLDNDGLTNEFDPYPLNDSAEVASWDCASVQNPNPQDPSDNCVLWRTSYTGFNDWDGDGLNNWIDVDDDNDGILDWMDIDPDCDLDNDADLHELNGSMYRDDGANDIDTDIDGDGLQNDEDWDDDNDGINDFYDPDDGNCGIVDIDNTDNFWGNSWPQGDGDAIDGSEDSNAYVAVDNYFWNLTWGFNPFNEGNSFMLDYNGYDDNIFPPINGKLPEMYWFLIMKWSPYNGGNFFDIDTDGDSLINGIDVDQDGDGLPDWWDQDEGNDGVLDVDDVKMGGTLDGNTCETVLISALQERFCGHELAYLYKYPLLAPTQAGGQTFTVPYSSRPDPEWDDGSYDGTNHPTGQGSCTSNCYWFTFDPSSNAAPSVAYTYNDMKNNRDLWIAYLGVTVFNFFQWTSDANNNFFPDEIADELNDDIDPDVDCGQPMPEVSWVPNCMYNNTNDLDDDWDIVYDHFDVDDDNDGIWDYFEVDSNDDLDDDSNVDEPYYFTGSNCEDNDDDGLDTDPDDDGIYQAVWDRGVLGQALLFPQYYDVDNDNDGVPDGEDPDDDNNGLLDEIQETYEGCFTGEEQSPWDHDNDGILNWADDDWDGDGIPNSLELQNLVDPNGTADPFDDTCCLNFPIAPWDHDNDGIRDDFDEDDDYDGMKDEDEVMLWPSRFGLESTNPWDHDDFGGGVGMADPSNNTTGPDYYDIDDDSDGRADLDWNDPSVGNWAIPSNKTEDSSGWSSDWDSDNNGVLDNDDKIPTRITLTSQSVLWLDENRPAIFNGSVFWLDDTGFVPAPDIPVQVHIRYSSNGTSVIETIDVLTDENGNYIVGQFLFPEDIQVGPNTTYEIYSEVTEMFIHDYSSTLTDSDGDGIPDSGLAVEVRANTTIGFVSGQRFRADEQPLKLDFKVHYTADYNRGIFDNRLAYAPVSFTISDPGTQFGNITHPTVFDGYGNGYRADSGGWVSLSYNQSLDRWEQVQWNSLLDNGPGIPTGGYEEIVWNPCTELNPRGSHSVLGPYEYKNTTLPVGDYSFVGFSRPDLGGCTHDSYEWPWAHLEGSKTDTFYIRSMHRMYVEAEMYVSSFRPVYFWDSTQFTGSSFGAWRALFHAPSLANSGTNFAEASLGKPYPILWDGSQVGLEGIAGGALSPFLSSNGTHWAITMQNGADFDSPPCGPVDPLLPNSETRCEIVPEMFTGETFRVVGHIWNRTLAPWTQDAIALQVDIDNNGVFAGSLETAYSRRPSMVEGLATFDYNWTWYAQYPAGTFGVKTDFTLSDYYFTGEQAQVLAATGAYGNVTVIGTTDFQLNTLPRLYRGQNTTVEARLIDNAFQPVREVPVNWTWSEDLSSGVSITDNNGVFRVNLTDIDTLGNFSLGFTYLGDSLRQGNSAEINMWVVSRTFLNVQSTSPNIRYSGDLWEFTAVVTDDNKTPFDKDGGQVLNSCAGEMQNPDGYDLGGNVTVIFEGIDFEDRTHRQIVSVECPASGSFSYGRYLDPQLLKDDPFSFLPDGFGPVNVILRFEENLPHEGCEKLDAGMLATSGAWDPCVTIINSDHFRKVLQFQVDGFSLIGTTILDVDQQIVYTSEIDPNTGKVLEKPMIVTGQLTDELGGNLSSRQIRVTFQMGSQVFDPIKNETQFIAGDEGVQACLPGATDENGFFEINCPLAGVDAGTAKVMVEYNAWDTLNNDRYRYKNKTQPMFFPVFSNSSIEVSEIGPFRSDYLTYTFPNGSSFDVLYLKEAFHINAKLSQSNGKPVGGKCVNIYLDPEINTRPIATAFTSDGTGEFVWYSADPDDNPSRRGVEPSGNNLEGFRTVRVAYEPEKYVPGGCDYEDLEPNPVLNSSVVDIEVLVRSKVDILLKEHWSSPVGYQEGEIIAGEVAILRDRLDLTVEGQRVEFHRQFWNGSGWQTERVEILITNERGSANFSFPYTADIVPGHPEWSAVDGKWRILVHFESADANKPYFVERWLNSTPVIFLGEEETGKNAGLWTTQALVLVGISMSTAVLVGAVMYNNYRERRKVEVLRGILTDALMSLKASNNYIEAIFSCYKDLIKYFRMKGAMKKVFETTREFEDVINNMLGGIVPPEELDMFFSIFEEARYSDHEIGSEQRDRAIQIFQSMIGRMNSALGDSMLTRTSATESALYGPSIKAGQFVDADGNVRYAGIDDSEDTDGFKI
tara:strand:- start:966 stop:8855 length:7890 start_codon:yes stop_codon:yes gene_type:complete